jgi:hypothetical protein
MLQMLQSQNYDLQELTKPEGSICTQNHERKNERLFKIAPIYIMS